MSSHIFDVDIKKILRKNETKSVIKLSRRYRLDQISKLDCDNCFQKTKVNLTIEISRIINQTLTKSIMFTDIFSIISITNLTNIKTRLFNESMTYKKNDIVIAYAKLIDEFFTLWVDNDFINISTSKWIKFLLKGDWNSKSNEK